MKSKISLFNKAVFKRNLTGTWCLWGGLLVFYLLLMPVSMYGYLSDALRYHSDISKEYLGALKVTMVDNLWSMGFFVPFFAVAALICAMCVFSYLFTSRNSNMMHTYPVSRGSLFATNYVTGLLFLLVPLMLAAFLMLVVGAVYGLVNGSVIKYYLIWMCVASLENLFFFSLAVCVLMFVGNMVAVPVLYLILNFLYDGCMLIADAMLSTVCYGLDVSGLTRGSLGVLTPIIYLSRVGIQNSIGYDGFNVQCTVYRLNVLPGYFAAAVVLTVVAVAAYKKKHIETAGDVITVNWLKPVFRWGAAVCVSALGALFFISVFYTNSIFAVVCSAAVVGIVVFFIAEMLLQRSVHVFTKRKIRECVIYTAVVCACYFAMDLDMAGLEKKIPAADEIQAVRVNGSLYMLAHDEGEISWVQDIHGQIIASKKEFERMANDGGQTLEYISLEYLLKDGSSIKRSYGVPALDEDGSVSRQIQDYAQRPEVLLKQFFGIHYPDIEVYGGTWETYKSNGEMHEERITEADARQIYEALVSDVNSGKLDKDVHGNSVTADTIETIGELTLNVRDEAGYISALNYYSVKLEREGGAGKEGTAYVSVDDRLTGLLEKMRALGYLSDEE